MGCWTLTTAHPALTSPRRCEEWLMRSKDLKAEALRSAAKSSSLCVVKVSRDREHRGGRYSDKRDLTGHFR